MSRGSKNPRPGLAALAWLLGAAAAQAQPAPTDAALAEQLFEEAKGLLEARRYGEACPKFAESHRLDPAGGTILLLAQCHEAQGKIATAWAEFKESLARAKEAGNARRERISRERIAALEPQLSTLTLRVPPEVAALPGLRLLRGGVSVGPVLWGAAMFVDPGPHEIVASADGHESWSQRVEVGPKADHVTLSLPPLRPRPAPAASSAPAPPSSASPPSSMSFSHPSPAPQPPGVVDRTAAFVALGLGAVGLGLGAYFGARAFSDARYSNDRCPRKDCADAEAVRRGNDAVREATLSNVAGGLGLLATGVGVYLWLSAPSPRGALLLRPAAAPGHLFVSGRVTW